MAEVGGGPARRIAPDLAVLHAVRGEIGSGPVADLVAGDAAALWRALEIQRLTSLVGSGLLRSDAVVLQRGLRESLNRAYDRDRRHAELLGVASQAVQAALHGAGIACLPLKGAALAERLHGDPALRRSEDVDVLIAPEDLAAGCEALAPLGYSIHGWDPAGALPVLHAYLVHAGGLPPVELHWRIHWYESTLSAEMLQVAGERPAGHDPLHDFPALLLYYARDGLTGLRSVADLRAWWLAHGASLDAERLHDIVERNPGLEPSLVAASAVAERLTGLPMSTPFAAIPDRRRTRMAVALSNWSLNGNVDQIKATVDLVDVLLAPPGRLREPLARIAFRSLEDVGGHGVMGRATHVAKLSGRFALAFALAARDHLASPGRRRRGAGPDAPGDG